MRGTGMASRSWRVNTVVRCAFDTSTTGEEPDTVTDSSTAPTRSSALTVAVKLDGSSIRSWMNVANPWIVNVTLYKPGRRSTTVYRPCASLTTVRDFSITAG